MPETLELRGPYLDGLVILATLEGEPDVEHAVRDGHDAVAAPEVRVARVHQRHLEVPEPVLEFRVDVLLGVPKAQPDLSELDGIDVLVME